MCRMASEEPQVSTNLSPFCLDGMTRKPSIRGACHYFTYDSGTIQLAPDLVDTPRFTGLGFKVIRVHNTGVFSGHMSALYFRRGIKLLFVLLG